MITVYTDGACKGNPGKGGWGVFWNDLEGKSHEFYGGETQTTNNRMELMAVIAGLKALTKKSIPVVIYSDSQYVVNAVEKGWLNTWIKTDFKGGKKNKDLWKHYFELSKKFTVKFIWVKGHADNPHNNRCDELATLAADNGPWQIDTEYEAIQ
jgi:ribonuclease HI